MSVFAATRPKKIIQTKPSVFSVVTSKKTKLKKPTYKNIVKMFKQRKVPRHEIAELLLHFEGKPLDLSDYKLFHPLYDNETLMSLYMTGRQTTKSSSLANLQVMNCSMRSFYKSIYAAPVEQQVNRYSNLYIKPRLTHSPIIKKRFVEKASMNNVKLRILANGSYMQFVHVLNSPDSARGITGDEINFDEVQDMDADTINIIKEFISASQKYGFERYCGTAKTMDNLLEGKWQQTSMCEWVMKCHRCNTHNFPTMPYVIDMISEKGPVCYKCRKPIDVTDGEWVIAFEERHDFFPGYHVPQTIVPINTTQKMWKKVWHKFLTYPRSQFIQECLGISHDLGGKIITLTELKELCILDYNPSGFMKSRYIATMAGVDWAISASNSFTCIVVFGVLPNMKSEIIYFKKWTDTDILRQINEIAEIANTYLCEMVCCDFGVGHTNNEILRQKLGVERVQEFQYTGGTFFVKWQKNTSWYMLNRTQSLNTTFLDMKDGKILFPKYDQCTEVCDHILSIYEDLVDTPSGKKKVFRKNHSIPDDFMHALNFGYTGMKMYFSMLPVEYDSKEDFRAG